MFALLFRGFVFVSVVTTYTFSVWNLITKHFIDEFSAYLNNKESVIRNTSTTPYVSPKHDLDSRRVCTKQNLFAELLYDYLHLHECKDVVKH